MSRFTQPLAAILGQYPHTPGTTAYRGFLKYHQVGNDPTTCRSGSPPV